MVKLTRVVLGLAMCAAILFSMSDAGASSVSGCGGADFGAGCSLQELIGGGSIETGGVRLDQWTLPGNVNEIGANLSLIEVQPINELVATGITYLTGGAISYVPGATSPSAVDLKLGFRVTGLAGAQVTGDALEILSRTFGANSVSAFVFLAQADCTDGFNAPAACSGPITGGSPQAISDQLFPPDELLGVGSFAAQTAFFVTLGIQLGGDPGDSVTLNSFEQRFDVTGIQPVPEPSSLLLLAGGVGLLALRLRSRR